MTLARLIEAVGAGTARPGQYGHPDVMFMEVWPPTVSGPQLWQYASEAYDGSLDAAAKLHEALLPGWRLTNLFQFDAGSWYARVHHPQGDDWPKWTPYPFHESNNATAARAWLLAILRAMEGRDG